MYKYINNYTGEVFKTLPKAIKCAIRDMFYYPKCRTIKMLNISKKGTEIRTESYITEDKELIKWI